MRGYWDQSKGLMCSWGWCVEGSTWSPFKVDKVDLNTSNFSRIYFLLNFSSFLHTQNSLVQDLNSPRKKVFVPAVHNMVFDHGLQSCSCAHLMIMKMFTIIKKLSVFDLWVALNLFLDQQRSRVKFMVLSVISCMGLRSQGFLSHLSDHQKENKMGTPAQAARQTTILIKC
jgi:hypothetical protein